MDNNLTSFSLFAHLGVNNIQATGVLNKKPVTQLHYHWGKTAGKKGTRLL